MTQAPAQVLSNLSPQLPPLSHVSTLCVMTQSWGSPTLHAKSWGWWTGLDNFIMTLETRSGGFVSETLGFWLKSARNWLEEAVWPRLTQARCGQQRKQPQVTGHSAQSARLSLYSFAPSHCYGQYWCQAGDRDFNITLTYQNPLIGDFPGSPVVKASPFYYTGAGWSLVGELRSFMLHSVAKKKKKELPDTPCFGSWTKPSLSNLHILNFKSVQPRMEEECSRPSGYRVGYENAGILEKRGTEPCSSWLSWGPLHSLGLLGMGWIPVGWRKWALILASHPSPRTL